MLRIREDVKAKEVKVYGQMPYFSPHHFLNYVLNLDVASHNSLGFRGKEISIFKEKNTYRIFCLGGSSVYGSRVLMKESYPYRLNEILDENIKNRKTEVINAGVPGYTSANQFILFQFRLLSLSPDMIIVYSGFNDVFPRLMGVNTFDYSGFNRPWKSVSVLRRILFSSLISQKVIGRIGKRLKITFLTWPPHIHELVQDKPYQYFSSKYRENFDSTSIKVFKRNLLSLIQLAKANSVEVVLLTQSLAPAQDNDSLFQILKQALSEHNSTIRYLARKTNVYLVDLEKIFPKRPSLFSDEIHMSPEGNRLRAKIIYDSIARIINK